MAGFTILCILQILISPIFGFFHEPSMLFLTRPLQPDSFFGFSMAYDEKTLMIGAPAADKYGKVFQVGLTQDIRYEEIFSPLIKDDDYTLAEYDWFGASIKTYKSPLSFVICAPRKIQLHTNGEIKNMHTTRGQCYKGSKEWLLLPDIQQAERKYFNFGMDAFGWSVDVDDDRAIWISSPVIPNNTIKIYDKSTKFKMAKFFPFNASKMYNFGYSIVSGNFLSDNKNDHAVSCTYGDFGKGKVFVFQSPKIWWELAGDYTAVGSAYGAALCKANLGDKRASLLVGAPTFVTEPGGYDRGAVYVYVPSDGDTKSLILKRLIKGEKDGSHFGHALASIGDLDGDQKDEVAISAPFEDDGKGAVYIYSGAGLLGNKTWAQRIQRESNAFGFSLIPMPNYVDNGLSGLSVGAPLENKVYVLKPIPSITVTVDAVIPNRRVSQDDQPYINITAVFNVKYPTMTQNISTKLNVNLRVEHPDAKLENATDEGVINYKIPLDVTLESINHTFRISTPSEGNYSFPISYKLSVDLFDEDVQLYDGRVLRSERSVMSKEREEWLSDCEAATCKSNLSVVINNEINDPYTVGSSDKEYFSLTIRNYGETAHSPCAVVNVKEVLLLRAPPDCIIENNGLVCKLSHPLRKNMDWKITNIELGMDSLTTKKKGRNSINIFYEIYSDCNNKTDKKSANKTIALRYDNGVRLIGISVPSEPVEITTSDLQNVTRLQHHYSIMNNGKMNWKDVKCDILLQTRNYLRYPKDIIIRRGPDTIECVLEVKKVINESFTVACNIGDLLLNNIVEVFIDVEVLPHLLGKKSVSVPSQLSLILLEEESISKNITTTLVINTRSVPVWIIIISVLFGFLVLLLIGLILYRYNCFERKDKKKLEGLKTHAIDEGEKKEGEDGSYSELPEEENIIVAVEPHIEPNDECNLEHKVEPNVVPNNDNNHHNESRVIN